MDEIGIKGVEIRRPECYHDRRGWLIELFRQDELRQDNLPRMAYVSMTLPGIARGPHEHKHQTDIFAFIGPGNFKVKLWDNRKKSGSYGNVMTYFAGMDNPLLIVVPPGVVHGYKNITRTERGMVLNYPDQLFKGWGKKEEVDEIRHEDQEDEYYRDFISES